MIHSLPLHIPVFNWEYKTCHFEGEILRKSSHVGNLQVNEIERIVCWIAHYLGQYRTEINMPAFINTQYQNIQHEKRNKSILTRI